MYLVNNVGEAGGEVDREHNENDIAFWVAQWPQSVVFFLAGGIQHFQHARLLVDNDLLAVGVFDSWVICFDKVVQAELLN